MYLVLILVILKGFCQVLIGAFCLCELFSQLLIEGLQSADLTLLLSKSESTQTQEIEIELILAIMFSNKVVVCHSPLPVLQ